MLLMLLGCPAPDDTGIGDDANVSAALGKVFSVSWEDSGLEVAVENSEQASWWFGTAETKPLDPLSDFDPWQGEDCFEGDQTSSGRVVWCHPIEAGGTRLRYGGDPALLSTGEETAMRPRSWERKPVYYFLNILDGQCYIGGTVTERYKRLCGNDTSIAVRQTQSEIGE